MDKFVISLPKFSLSNAMTPSFSTNNSSKKRKLTGSGSSLNQSNKRRLETSDKENVTNNVSDERSPASSSNKKVQMYLDFGQKSLLETIQCAHCDLLFRSHDLDDLKQHQQYCKERFAPPQATTYLLQKGQILNEFPYQREKIFYLAGRGKKFSPNRSQHLAIPPQSTATTTTSSSSSAPASAVKTFSRKDSGVKPWMKSEEENAPVTPHTTSNSGDSQPASSSLLQHQCLTKLEEFMKAEFGLAMDSMSWTDCDLYLFLQDKSIIGAIMIDSILPSSKIQIISDLDDLCAPPCATMKKDDGKQQWLIGVRYLWVHKDYRRKQVGKRLLDEVRRSHLFGVVADVSQVAFTQLTEDGFNFAKYYCRAEQIACYDPENK